MLTSSTQSFGDEDGMHAPDGRGEARDFPNRGNYIAKAVPATTAVYKCKRRSAGVPCRAPMAANYSICIKFWHAAAPRLRRPQKPVARDRSAFANVHLSRRCHSLWNVLSGCPGLAHFASVLAALRMGDQRAISAFTKA